MCTDDCHAASWIREFPYYAISRLCMMLYYTRPADMAFLSIRVPAYAFAGGRMLSEAFLFLIAVVRQCSPSLAL